MAFVTDPRLTGTHYKGHWVSDGSREELVKSFDDFEPDLRELVKVGSLHTDQICQSKQDPPQLCEKPSKWALHVVKPLPFCVRKRAALIGDAVGLPQDKCYRHV